MDSDGQHEGIGAWRGDVLDICILSFRAVRRGGPARSFVAVVGIGGAAVMAHVSVAENVDQRMRVDNNIDPLRVDGDAGE